MNKRHKRISRNQERWLKRLASEVPSVTLIHDIEQVRSFWRQAYFTPRAAAQVVLKMRRGKCQALARHLRQVERGADRSYGNFFEVKWAMFVYTSVDADLTSQRATLWLRAYEDHMWAEPGTVFTRF